jgi:hypothetical protein
MGPTLSIAGGTRYQVRWIRAPDTLVQYVESVKLCEERAGL